MKKKDFDALDLAGGNQAEAVDPVVVEAWRTQFEEEREMAVDSEIALREMRRERGGEVEIDEDDEELAALLGGMGIAEERAVVPIEPHPNHRPSVLTVQEVKRSAEDAFDNDSEEEDDSGVATTPEEEALRAFYAAWTPIVEEDAEDKSTESDRNSGKKRRVQVEEGAPEEGIYVEPTGSAAPNPVVPEEDDDEALGVENDEFDMELTFPLGITVGGRGHDSTLGESVVTVAETPSCPDAEERVDGSLPSFVGGDDDAAGAMLVEGQDLTVPGRVITGTVVFDANAFGGCS